MTNRTWYRAMAALLAVALALAASFALAACGDDEDSDEPAAGASDQPGKGKPPVTLGAKNFTEQFILGQLYKQALEAKGYTVRLKNNIGSSEITDKALTSGKIDMYPEYTGVIVQELAKEEERPRTADETYQRAKAFEEKRGYAVLEKTPFFNADALAVKPEYAREHGLKTAADLRKVPGFKFGAPPENRTRFQGAVGMREVYKLDFRFVPLTIGLQYKALESDRIDVAAVFTTDGQLEGGKLTVLDDPEGIFGFQNVAPVVDQEVLSRQGPEFAETLNAVSAKLTNEAMRRMNGAVDLDKRKPAEVASQFLEANGLK